MPDIKVALLARLINNFLGFIIIFYQCWFPDSNNMFAYYDYIN